MPRPATLTPTSSGTYYRQLGYQPTGSQPRFNLGTSKAEALARNAKLEELWRLVRERAANMNAEPAWDEVTLAIAREVAAGSTRFVLTPNPQMEGADSYLHWVARYAEAFGGVIPVVPSDPTFYAEGVRAEEAARREYLLGAVRFAELAYPGGGAAAVLPAGQTVHQAFAAYRDHVRATRKDADGRVTEWGERLSDLVDHLRRLTPDRDLAEFGQAAVDAVVEAVRARPPARTHAARNKSRISLTYARNLLKAFRPFVRWLHRSEQFNWRRPADYEVTPVKIPKTDDGRASAPRSLQVSTYTPGELTTLWRYAHPMERGLMVLALNCAFGRRELATLRRDEVALRQAHPHADVLGLPSGGADSWVMRLRTKTDVYGEWRLWPQAVAAVDWYAARRPASELPNLLLTARGRPLADRTAGNNSNARVANAWARLTDRVSKDDAGFRRLSFNKIRKTAVNHLRRHFGGEVASLFAAHGRPFAADTLTERYANKPFARLHGAVADLGRWLQPGWDAVPDPFPAAWTEAAPRGGPNISRGTTARIADLHAAGKRIADIARETGLSRETVRRWVTRAAGGGTCSP